MLVSGLISDYMKLLQNLVTTAWIASSIGLLWRPWNGRSAQNTFSTKLWYELILVVTSIICKHCSFVSLSIIKCNGSYITLTLRYGMNHAWCFKNPCAEKLNSKKITHELAGNCLIAFLMWLLLCLSFIYLKFCISIEFCWQEFSIVLRFLPSVFE